MQRVLKTYQKRLTNLTGNNRALLLLKLNNRQFIDLHQLDFLTNKPSFHVIESLVARRKKAVLGSNMDSRDKNANAAAAILNHIRRTDRFIRDERGARDLYVGYPFVQGKMQDDTPVRCPLLFFPVELVLEQNNWILRLREHEEIMFNKTFLLAYSHYNNVTFDEQFLDQDFEDFSKDSTEFRTGLYRLIEESPLEINFNRENFTDQLQTFRQYTKTDFVQQERTGELKLVPEAVLGVFPLSDSYLAPDYEFLLSQQSIRDIDEFFCHSEKSEAIDEHTTIAPYPLDASQEYALKSIKAGKSMVIQGPPGTGKSQLICNLVSDYIGRGKRVLLVCQKRAALDVVYQRLQEKEIHEFVALVHDFRNDRKNIYEQINRHIEQLDEYRKLNMSFDMLYIETHFEKLSREIDELTGQLEAFRLALFDTQECGLSVKELYLTSDKNKPYISLRDEYQSIDFNAYPDFKRKLESYILYSQKLKINHHPWKDRLSFRDYKFEDVKKLDEAVSAVPAARDSLSAELQTVLDREVNIEDFRRIAQKETLINKLQHKLSNEKVFDFFRRVISYKDTDLQWLVDIEEELMTCFEQQGIETSLDTDELDTALVQLQQFIKAQQSFFGRMQWSLFVRERKYLIALATVNELALYEPDQAEILMARIRNRSRLEHLRHKLIAGDWMLELSADELSTTLDSMNWLSEIPETLAKADFERWFEQYTAALLAKEDWLQLQDIFSEVKVDTLPVFHQLLDRAKALAVQFAAQEKQAQLYLSDAQVYHLWHEPGEAQRLQTSLQKDFDLLCEFDALIASLKPHEQAVIYKLRSHAGQYDQSMIALLDNSLRLAWIDHIESRYPVLRAVSSLKLAQVEKDLQRAVADKSAISREMLTVRLRESTYSELAYNRRKTLVSYRDLKHQVTKKRYIYPLRKLVSLFADEVFNLLPCWMASPESVSAIFPMQELFDLVIFDEASQCFAEKGIPAMYRGRQVVIVGDDKQLAPTDLYRPRWEEDMDEAPELEVDSLLDLSNQHLDSVQLTGHYRSQSLDLIDFSNEHFYSNKLRLIPDYHAFIRQEPAIRYLKVDGVWEKNTNRTEAETVVRLVRELIAQDKTNIGVITFNAPQQMLIQDLLEEEKINLPEGLFVKNIENVQGDERDIIIFSVGYAPTAFGRMNMQFGSLNLAKGENRLNVAVTRARERIVIVSSIFPSQLNVDEATNEGARLLKKYLQYALEVSEGKYKPTLPAQKKYHIDWYLKKKLPGELKTYRLEENLPFADLSVMKGSLPEKLVLTDDNLYHDSISAREAHVYLPFMLRMKNWPFVRVYSRPYWVDAEEERERMEGFCRNEPLI